MAKKKKNKAGKALQSAAAENILPQNILPMGSRVEEAKNIYIAQNVYKQIHRFTKNKTVNESGGMLVGSVIEEFGKTNILISGFVEARFCEGTPTTLKFTHETWDYVHKEIEKKHKGKKIVGWIHTHPDFGIFLSEYDKFIHQNFFNEDHQIAYVVDPIQNIEGFYFWINGNIERCKGFYIYDKTGEKITVEAEKDEPTAAPVTPAFGVEKILIALLSVIVVFLIFSQISTNNKVEELQKEQQSFRMDMEQYVTSMQGMIADQSQQIYYLQMQIGALQPTQPPATDPTPPATEDQTPSEPVEEETAPSTEPTEATEEQGVPANE